MRSALFPLSVSNELFSSARYLDCLGAIPVEQIDSCTFLIADQLQIYNLSGTLPVSEVLTKSTATSHRLERARWISRIIDTLQHTDKWSQRPIEFSIISIEQILDAAFFRIYRGLRVLFSTSERFKKDVVTAARNHVLSLVQPRFPETMVALSTDYIIEELAINVRVRVGNQLLFEFYPGEYHTPLINLYRGLYGVTHFDLCGRSASSEIYRFFSFSDASGEWKDVSNDGYSNYGD